MEFPNEVIPLVVGLVFAAPLLMVVTRRTWTDGVKFAAGLVTSMIIGAGVSFLMGELAHDLPEAAMAIVIDTSLIYTGSQIAYWLFWKPVSEVVSRRRESSSVLTRN